MVLPGDQYQQQQDKISLTAMLGQVCVQWSGASSFEAGTPAGTGELSQHCIRQLRAEREQLLAKGLRGLVEAVLKGRQQRHDAAVFFTRQIFLRLAGALQVLQHILASFLAYFNWARPGEDIWTEGGLWARGEIELQFPAALQGRVHAALGSSCDQHVGMGAFNTIRYQQQQMQ